MEVISTASQQDRRGVLVSEGVTTFNRFEPGQEAEASGLLLSSLPGLAPGFPRVATHVVIDDTGCCHSWKVLDVEGGLPRGLIPAGIEVDGEKLGPRARRPGRPAE
jgi:hypothetical protein